MTNPGFFWWKVPYLCKRGNTTKVIAYYKIVAFSIIVMLLKGCYGPFEFIKALVVLRNRMTIREIRKVWKISAAVQRSNRTVKLRYYDVKLLSNQLQSKLIQINVFLSTFKSPLILLCWIISVECPKNFECTLVSCHLKKIWSLNFEIVLRIDLQMALLLI